MAVDGFPVDVVGGVSVVAVPEEIDVTNATGLRLALLEAAGHGRKRLVVDMSRTRFCDSAALHVLVAAHRRAQGEQRELLLAISGPAVLRIFALNGLDRVIPCFASLDEALRRTAASRRLVQRDDGGDLIQAGDLQQGLASGGDE